MNCIEFTIWLCGNSQMFNSTSITRGFNEKQISSSYKTLTIPSLQLHVAQWIRLRAWLKSYSEVNLLQWIHVCQKNFMFITTSAFLNQLFFECLRERISCGGKKKRLPNFTTGFVRRDAVPLGTFTKYTWHITNIIHVKQIFETPLVSTFTYLFI